MSEAETKTISGVCSEIAQKPGNDWTEFHIDAGGQWPVKVATKLQPLIELGKAVGSNIATWTYKEVESDKINEKSGKPFVNRYLEGVEIGGVENPAGSVATPAAAPRPGVATGPPPSTEGMTPEKWDAKERRDYRSRAWAQTLAAFQHTIKVDEDPGAVFARLQPFQRQVFTDVCQSFAFPPDESDIPF